jgi:hypothetical protein
LPESKTCSFLVTPDLNASFRADQGADFAPGALFRRELRGKVARGIVDFGQDYKFLRAVFYAEPAGLAQLLVNFYFTLSFQLLEL